MELKFNEAKTVRPNHLERCLCYDKFLKGYRCYVYDDISKYWCTQATTVHDQDGDNHIVDYADYQVTKWASLRQEQPEAFEISKFCQPMPENIVNCVAEHYWEMLDDEEKEDERTTETTQQEQPEVDLEKEFESYMEKHNGVWIDTDYIKFARHFYELGLNARKK